MAYALIARQRHLLPPLLLLALVVVLWEVLVRAMHVPPYLLPAPSAVAAELGSSPDYYLANAWVTLAEAVGGLALGSLIGFGLGAIMARSVFAERLLMPLAVGVRVTPVIAVAPIFIIWFGFTIWPKIIVAALITFFPVLTNTIVGLRAVDARTLELLRSVHASEWEIFTRLRVPNALPYLFAALKIGVSLALIGALVGELVGAREGLGHVIDQASINLVTRTVFSAVVALTGMGILLTELTSAVERRALFWHESQRTSVGSKH
jgi:NitT/TauT family transport system permease protein